MLPLLQTLRARLPFPSAPTATPAQIALKQIISQASPLQIIIGAGPTQLPGWIATDLNTLNVVRLHDWKFLFGRRRLDCLLAEHVWEHLSPTEAAEANSNCFYFLKPGGRLRVAVPDALHPDPSYREWVRPGGCGPGADDHKVLYDYKLLGNSLAQAGFEVELLEYWDGNSQFHFSDWSSADGHVARSKRYDVRNRNGSLAYTSLIVDAVKPE